MSNNNIYDYEVSIPQALIQLLSALRLYGICIPVISAAELPLSNRNHPPHAFVSASVPGSSTRPG